MAWGKADNWTAFSNGDRTWINGPAGLVVRANWQRLPFEANPDGLLWPPELYTPSHWASEIANMQGQSVDWKSDKTSFMQVSSSRFAPTTHPPWSTPTGGSHKRRFLPLAMVLSFSCG